METLSRSEKLTTINNHYSETFLNLKEQLNSRNRLFLYMIIVISIMLLKIYSPADFSSSVSNIISDKLGLSESIDISFIETIIWISLLGIAIRYFQTVIHIERQYDYIHHLEDEMNSIWGSEVFTREGKSYLSNYPKFSSWVWILYTIMYPILLAIIVISKILNEYNTVSNFSFLFIINVVIFFSILISILLYMLLIHFKK